MTEPFAELAREINQALHNYNGPTPVLEDVLSGILKPRLSQAARQIAARAREVEPLFLMPKEVEQILTSILGQPGGKK